MNYLCLIHCKINFFRNKTTLKQKKTYFLSNEREKKTKLTYKTLKFISHYEMKMILSLSCCFTSMNIKENFHL